MESEVRGSASSQFSQNPPLPDKLEAEREFIALFETLRVLWDTANVHYNNKYKRQQALEKLLVIFKSVKPLATIEDVKKKINSLRSNYRRELKKNILSKKSGAGTGVVYTPKSWTFQYLHFLNKLERPVSQSVNPEDLGDENSIQPPHRSEHQEKNISQLNSNNSYSSVVEIPKPSSSKGGIVKKRSGQLAKHSRLLNRACTFLAQPSKVNPLAIHWTNKLEKLDPSQRIYAEKAIHDVLFEAELGNLNRYSVKINEPRSSHISSVSSHCAGLDYNTLSPPMTSTHNLASATPTIKLEVSPHSSPNEGIDDDYTIG